MTKSNLFILLLLLIIPVGLLLHTLALRAAYRDAKSHPMAKYEGDFRYHRTLPPYKHIAVDGTVRLKSKRKSRSSMYHVSAQIWVGPDQQGGLTYRQDMKPFLKTEVRNDTLYCWFEADNSRDWLAAVRSYRELEIKVPQIESISAGNLNMEIYQLAQQAPVALRFAHMNVAGISYVDVPFLDVKSNRALVHISGGRADTLRYELEDESYLTVNRFVAIREKELVRAGKGASFTLSGVTADPAMPQQK
ncbi:hypothetical protein WJU16_10195 [Chitinophaga pollutisoli]|uniref:DUF3108 domain-containing protein n=1 Tax=Chitinophaga pollutisoli TaxID=3133966 RepID=A0ABZ2YUH7_9BACT